MDIAILHNAVADNAGADEHDVLVQRDFVANLLSKLGHCGWSVSCTLDLEALKGELTRRRPDVAFNLVEALGGTDRLMPLVPLLLEALDIPYTGSPVRAIHATNDKVRAKSIMRSAGLPTPGWLDVRGKASGAQFPGRYIVKCRSEHASVGIEEDAVVFVTGVEALRAVVQERTRLLGRECFAEGYVEGREFNLSVLAGHDGPQILPHAEIDFGSFPDGKTRIVGYRAKWEPGSFEYDNTPRTFRFKAGDRPLLLHLTELARRAWLEFELGGWARVDFRVDGEGHPYILEVNANPCLSPDAGFMAAVDQAGVSPERAIERILEDALDTQTRPRRGPVEIAETPVADRGR